jgi:hypothetical protein
MEQHQHQQGDEAIALPSMRQNNNINNVTKQQHQQCDRTTNNLMGQHKQYCNETTLTLVL